MVGSAAVATLESGIEAAPGAGYSEAAVSKAARSSPAAAAARALWRGRRRLSLFATGGGLLSLLLALLIPNRYQSTTRLMAPDLRVAGSEAWLADAVGRGGGGMASLGASLLGAGNSAALFVGVLQSRSVAENLVRRFDLKRVYRTRRDEDARALLAERSVISEERKSGIISIAVEDRDPARAAALAGAYAEELNRRLAEVNTSAAHRERVFIEERLQAIRPELDRAARQLSDFSSKNTTLDPKEQGRAMVGAAVALQGELIANQTALRGLEQIYSDNNVRVRSLRARIAELRRQLNQMRGGAEDAIPGTGMSGREKSAEEDSEKDIEDEGAASYPSFRQLPQLGVTYTDLYREVKLREIIFETLTQQYEMAKIAEAKEIPTVKLLDPANVPERKSGPHRLLLAGLGAMVAFAAGALFMLGKSAWSEIDPADPRRRIAAEIWADTRSAGCELRQKAGQLRNKWGRGRSQAGAAPRAGPPSAADPRTRV